MRTKIRLALDCSVQLLLILLLGIKLYSSPEQALQYLAVFAFFISIWQIGHAVYVVEKYQDWYRGLYLKNMERVLSILTIILLISAALLLVSFGLLLPYILKSLQVLVMAFGVLVALMAFQYFGRSLINIYIYYTKPRSFWDL